MYSQNMVQSWRRMFSTATAPPSATPHFFPSFSRRGVPRFERDREVVKLTRVFNIVDGKSTRRMLRRNMPEAEIILWSRLRRRCLLGYKFRRQYGIGRYSVDFFCPELKLAIEVDGSSHFVEHAEERDRIREEFIGQFGVCFLRFTNSEVRTSLNGVLTKIEEVVKSRAHQIGAHQPPAVW
jgi:very-short-patch-repair endonuclease